MTKYKFVLFNSIPTTTDEADKLSNSMTLELGEEDWSLVSTNVIQIKNRDIPGLFLSFQKQEK